MLKKIVDFLLLFIILLLSVVNKEANTTPLIIDSRLTATTLRFDENYCGVVYIKECGMKKLVYGNVVLYEIICKHCKEKNLVGNPFEKCSICKIQLTDKKIKNVKVIVTAKRKNRVSAEVKKRIQKEQDGLCYWCDRPFGVPYIKNNKISKLKIHYDHKIPFSYTQNNEDDNFVGACNICNQAKSSFVYDNESDCKNYLKEKWEQKIAKGEIELI